MLSGETRFLRIRAYPEKIGAEAPEQGTRTFLSFTMVTTLRSPCATSRSTSQMLLDSLPALRAAKLEPSLEVFPENVDGRRRHILFHHHVAHTCPAERFTLSVYIIWVYTHTAAVTTGTLAAVLLNLRQASGSLPVQEVLHCTQSREGATHAHAHTHAHARARAHTHTQPRRGAAPKKRKTTPPGTGRTPPRYGLGGVLGTVGGSRIALQYRLLDSNQGPLGCSPRALTTKLSRHQLT